MNELNKQPTVESLEGVLLKFDAQKEHLGNLCQKTKALIEDLLDDAGIKHHSVQARVKSRKKLESKYTNVQKNYTCLEDITDLAGLRVITYYEDQVDQVAKLIRREFVIDVDNSSDKRMEQIDGFGYHAVNYVVTYSQTRQVAIEYRKFASSKFEVQVTSILRHAWSEIEHEWYDLHEHFPPDIRRRFYRMAALLEVAESEFLALRNKRSEFERSMALRIEAKVSNIPIDSASLKSFIEHEPLVAELDLRLCGVIGAPGVAFREGQAEVALKLLQGSGIETIGALRANLNTHSEAVVVYTERTKSLISRIPDSKLAAGASVFRLGMLLAAKRGQANLEDKMRPILKDAGLNDDLDFKMLSFLAASVKN